MTSGSGAISCAVEGPVDEAILRVLLKYCGIRPAGIYGKRGKSFLRQKVHSYNQAASYYPWIILVDLNHEAECAPALRTLWLPNPAPGMFFRIAVREVEAWLLGDQERISAFLGVTISKIPQNPEMHDDPKHLMIELAANSRRREIREDMVPRPGSGRKIGPAYPSRLIEFATNRRSGWRPEVAARNSDSLNRCLRRLNSLLKK
jgi:hypothetical protein